MCFDTLETVSKPSPQNWPKVTAGEVMVFLDMEDNTFYSVADTPYYWYNVKLLFNNQILIHQFYQDKIIQFDDYETIWDGLNDSFEIIDY
jgi:hypothetical protein